MKFFFVCHDSPYESVSEPYYDGKVGEVFFLAININTRKLDTFPINFITDNTVKIYTEDERLFFIRNANTGKL